MHESSLGIHLVKVFGACLQHAAQSCVIRDVEQSSRCLRQVTLSDVRWWLTVDTHLDTSRRPIDELDLITSLESLVYSKDLLWNDIAPEHQTDRRILACTRIIAARLHGGLKCRHRELRHCKAITVHVSSRQAGRIAHGCKVYPRVGYHVRQEVRHVKIQLTAKPEGSRYRRHRLRQQAIHIRKCWALYAHAVLANSIHGLVVGKKGEVREL
mmetsp:Transcript_30832/g.70736  ORF Transcript_30832/g.70736 Transcript_30832/m.70736 type:complete len:212 (+) Transcript_30832:189-824(+)